MLDPVLAFLLLIVLPARALWRSRQAAPSKAPKIRRYTVTIAMVAGLLAILAGDWWLTGRSLATLGLGIATTTPALIGLAIAVVLLAVAAIPVRRKQKDGDSEAARAGRELLPETPAEIRTFLLFALAVGFGWEVLYRGFLLYYLTPQIGLVWAVLAAALAYGAAHGFKSIGLFAGSIAAALAFTIGYALTANLWWLIVLHTGLPLLTLGSLRTKPR